MATIETKTDAMSTRDRLVEAAISIIESEGEVGIRVDRVAQIAGFTKPVLYHHFADREAVIAAAQAERFRRSLLSGAARIDSLMESVTTAEGFFDAMCQWLRSFGTLEGEERRKFRVEVLGSAASRPELLRSVIEANREYISEFAMLLRLAQAHGWLRNDVNAKDLAQWWAGLVLSRHVVEIDKEEFSTDTWDTITESVIRSMMVGM
jgi:AcrR family transcriptional regulator